MARAASKILEEGKERAESLSSYHLSFRDQQTLNQLAYPGLLSTTIRLVLVPLAPLAMPQQLAVLVNFC